MEFLISVVSAVAVGYGIFLGKKTKGDKFERRKLLRMALVGVMVGIVAQITGVTITAENYDAYLLSNGFIVIAGDIAVKAIYRLVDRKINKVVVG